MFLTKKYNLVTLEDAEKVFEPRPKPNERELNKDEVIQTNPELVVKDPDLEDVPECSKESVVSKEDSESMIVNSDQDSGLASHSLASRDANDADEEEGEFKSKGFDDLSDMDLFTTDEEDDEVFLEEKPTIENSNNQKLNQKTLVDKVDDCEIISSDEEW